MNQHELLKKLKINAPQMRAVIMRTNGAKFSEIGAELDVSENTVKNWFRIGTDTYGAYKEHAGNVAYSMGLDSEIRLRMLANKAADTLEEMMGESKPDAVRLRAALYIHDKVSKQYEAEKEYRAIQPLRDSEKYKQAESILVRNGSECDPDSVDNLVGVFEDAVREMDKHV
jgi:hypothetical protein